MCGIVGYIGKKEAAPILLDGLKKLEYRGYDSAGITVCKEVPQTVKTKGRLQTLEEKLQTDTPSGHLGIGHTRWATHGAPSDVNSHPHTSQTGRFTLVHNGIIENYRELRAELLEKGYTFQSETDTEIVVQLLEDCYTGDVKETLRIVLQKLRGSYAFGIICADHPEELVAVRKESPLLVGLGTDENYIASDIPALLAHTRDYYLLENDEIVVLTEDSIAIYSPEDVLVEKEIFHVTWDISAAEKGGYDYFMMKEIMEQPEALKKTILPRLAEGEEFLSLTDDEIAAIGRIHIVACGSAWHAGIVGKYVLEAMTRIPVEVDLASEFRYRTPILNANDLCVIISQSGETADTLAALREAKRNGVRVLAIVNVVGSSIAREADEVLYTWAGPEIAVATTKGYTTQLSVLYLLALHLAEKRKTLTPETVLRYTKALEELPAKTEALLALDQRMEALAKAHATAENVFLIGRGIDYAAVMEGSLKLKEISYIHSEAYAAGELKHGTISLIEEGTLVIAAATQSMLFEKLISNVREVKARGANVILLASEDSDIPEDAADEVILLPKTEELFCASLNVIPMQFFSYYIAKERGCDVDKPRNLAKSVTVE